MLIFIFKYFLLKKYCLLYKMSHTQLSLYEQSMKFNCKNIAILEQLQRQKDLNELKEAISCPANNTRQIRNVEHERPMMFPQYRFKHLNY